jgi:two-component system sensor kinase FixL
MPHFKRTFIVLFCLVFSLIVLMAAFLWRFNERYIASFSLVRHTLLVINETEETTVLLKDPSWQANSKEIQAHLENLSSLTRDNPAQQKKIAILNNLYAASEPNPSRLLDQLSAIRQEENRLLTSRDIINLTAQRQLRNVTPFIITGILLILAIFFWVILINFNRRKVAEDELQSAEQRFITIIEKIKDYSIFMTDPDGRIMSWNQGAAQLKGYSAQEAIGQPISIFYTHEDNAAGEPANNLATALQRGHFETLGWRRRKDDSLFWADVVITPLFDAKGLLAGFIKITKDITLQRETEEEMRNNLAREKELNEMKSRFVSFASHEFKTPLSVILSSVSLIERYIGAEDGEKRIKHINRIKSNVDSLRHILDDFLSLEKLEEGLTRNNPVPTELVTLTRDTIVDLQPGCKEGQTIEILHTGARRLVTVDPELLRNVLVNLVSNAIKYSPPSSAIQLHLSYMEDLVTLAVKDNGIGIPPEEQPSLFQRFFRGGNTTGTSGTGLGLSIVRRYLDIMGASISFRSEPGAGTEFTITLETIPQHAPEHRLEHTS